MILYEGPSMLDGAPIVAVVTGIAGKASRNSKTGDLVQVWILRADMDPLAASRSGADAGVCGDCPHRGEPTALATGTARGRSCYVLLQNAPLSVFRAFKRGVYARAEPEAVAKAIEGRGLRLGAYGDPAAIPGYLWDAICPSAAFVNGYTHSWRRFPALAAWCMASADSEEDRAEAKAMGWRTFRVRNLTDAVLPREVVCPASAEAGARTACALCKACGGASAKAKADIVIAAHGGGASNFARRSNSTTHTA